MIFLKQQKLRAGFDPATFTLPIHTDVKYDESFWSQYKSYLLTVYSKNTMYKSLCYAKKFAYVLQNNDAQAVLSLSVQKRLLVMQSLAALSKYLGCYDKWKLIRERYQLKWSTYGSLHIFNNIMNDQNSFSSMVQWLKDARSKLSKSYADILLYNALTGLRPDEACKSISLIHSNLGNYLSGNTMILEHYKHPDIFIRRTKNAYISVVSDSILEIAKQTPAHSYNSIRMAVRKINLYMHMAYCRKIFATHLRNDGIEQEFIDLLQGRTPKSVFSRHYFRPDFNHQRIRDSIATLYDKIKI
ncbi:MAG: hypothetical protein HY223_10180 [Thaumarchaeota archaeon]|nr:hypothetical protein [Nitrososphaerota archaeon]